MFYFPTRLLYCIHFFFFKAEPTNWSIFIYTSNIKDAGTDANVYIQIFGNKAASTQINLEKENENPFEKGNVDKFDYNLPDIGKIELVLIFYKIEKIK